MYLYLCSGDFIPTSDSIHGGHWFARCSSFPVWFRWNFLILLLSVDLNAALPQPSQVAIAHLAPHVASGSFYLSCLYFCVFSPPALIGVGEGGVAAAWPPSLSQGAACCSLFIYYLLFFSLLVIYIYAVFMGDTMSCFYLFMRAVGPVSHYVMYWCYS